MTGALTLPWPPSTNRYWRRVGGRVLISAEGRAYRTTVGTAVLQQRPGRFGAARLAMHITATPGDRRRRDLDNLLKALQDSLEHAGVYADDGQIDDLHIVRAPLVVGAGTVFVLISQMEAA